VRTSRERSNTAFGRGENENTRNHSRLSPSYLPRPSSHPRAPVGDGWTAFDRTFERDEPAYRDALAAAGRRRKDVLVLVAFESGRTGVDALRGSPWIEAPRDELARWQAAGADGAIVTARTSADIAALERAIGRW